MVWNSTLLTGVGLGAGLMFFLDPVRGRRRRAGMSDKVMRAFHKTGDGLESTVRDMSNRLTGTAAVMRRSFTSEAPEDRIVEERVRAAMGRVVSHPRAIDVVVDEGNVRLSGPIFSHEIGTLLAAVSWVRGVARIEDHLEPHAQADDVPGLQGGKKLLVSGWFPNRWTPTTRVLASAAGGTLAAYGLIRRIAAAGMKS
jgi:hypothetical protein